MRPVTSATGHGGPEESAHAPVGAAQLGLDLLRRAARAGRRDRGLGPAVVVDDEVHEARADELVVAPAERLPERTVRSDAWVVDVAVADRAVTIEQHGDAGDRLEGGRRRVALALELELALSALRDVEAARDDAHDPAGRVLHRRRPPVDRADLAARVRERVLVLARRVVGGEGMEARDHAVALARLDEEVPEVLTTRELLVGQAGRLERGDVDAANAAVGPDVHEQARRSVRHRADEPDLGSQLRLQPVVLERESRCGGDRLEMLGLGVEPSVVDDRGDADAVALDELHGAALVRRRLLDALALKVDPAGAPEAATPVEPVHDVELGIAERACERAPERLSCVQRHDELRHRRACEPRAQDAEQEGHRHGGERDEEERLDGIGGGRRDLVADHEEPDGGQGGDAGRDDRPRELPHRRTRACASGGRAS